MCVEHNKPKVEEVYDFLREHNALFVHFSGTPKGAGIERGEAHLFPNDLLHVARGGAMGGVSCSVVKPGDVFVGFERNATGSIGVVLGLQTKDSLVAVHPSDCGSIENEQGYREVPNEKDIAIADLDGSLGNRAPGTYNEWVVRNYQVLGIFAVPPSEVSILKVPDYPEEVPEDLKDYTPSPDFRCVTPDELAETFAGLPIFTFKDTRILQYCAGEGFRAIDHSLIYTTP
jgi:hypothetical protein